MGAENKEVGWMTKTQEDRLIQSCKLLVKKLGDQRYSRFDGQLPPAIRKQLDSIIRQAVQGNNK